MNLGTFQIALMALFGISVFLFTFRRTLKTFKFHLFKKKSMNNIKESR